MIKYLFLITLLFLSVNTHAQSNEDADLHVKIMQLEEQIRQINGRFEEMEFKLKSLKKNIATSKTARFDKQISAQKQAITKNSSPKTSTELYNFSFSLIKEKSYLEAAESFRKFIAKYPEDGLVANSYYWLGESYYARQDYKNASSNFLKGYNANQTGNKAPDNLLKLAMSLSLLGKQTQACTIFGQLESKFKKISPAFKKRLHSEQKRYNCK